MKKVLFIGHYREASGWGQAARDYIQAMLTIKDIDLVCRPLVLKGDYQELPESIKNAENKSDRMPDVCVQHVLPHFFSANQKIGKNIGLFVTETDTLKYTNWPIFLYQMDELWVPNNDIIRNICQNLDLRYSNKTYKVPHATDVSKFDKEGAQLSINEISGTFKFYFIGEFNRRKNLAALLEAFHVGFHHYDNVSLIIKTSIPGKSPQETKQIVQGFCDKVKSSLRMYVNHSYYKPEVIMTERLSENQLIGLHRFGDCFVNPSFGEAWSIPAFDAMGFGKTPININHGGPKEFVKEDDLGTGRLLGSYPEIICGVDDTIPTMFTGRERWMNIDRDELIAAMKHYQKNKFDSSIGKLQAAKFSYENVGKIISERLK